MKLKTICILITLLLSSYYARAIEIRGKVYDAKTKEELVGAIVQIKSLKLATTSGLDGSYRFTNISLSRTYTITVSLIGYTLFEKNFTITAESNKNKSLNLALEPSDQQLQEVVVSSHANRETEGSARISEKLSSNVLNIMSANAIQISPDLTVANVLQRVSGVSVEKSGQGEGRYPIIRGMDKRYSYTLINGIKIPSPDDKNRYIPLDIFPADLLERLEVIKSLTPDMEGDAIGGAMNLVMKKAPDRFILKANLATGYSQMLMDKSYREFNTKVIQDKSPAEKYGPGYIATPGDFPKANFMYNNRNAPPDLIAGLTIGNRFLPKKQLGILLGASYQNFYRAANSTFFTPGIQPDVDNTPVFQTVQFRKYSTQQTRIGINANADYVFNPKNKLVLSYLFVSLREVQNRQMTDSTLSTNLDPNGRGMIELSDRSRLQKQTINSLSLKGDHQITDNFLANYTAVYSNAYNIIPDWGTLVLTRNYHTDGSSYLLYRDINFPRQWQHNSDKDYTFMLNLKYIPKIAGQDVELSAGALYRHKDRDSYMNIYYLTPELVNNQAQEWTDMEHFIWVFKPASDGAGNAANANTYTSSENLLAGYAEAKLNVGQLEILGGVRIENTRDKYATLLPASADGKTGNYAYTDILPGLHFKYKLNAEQNLRLSYYASLSRPGFFEMIPYTIIGDYYTERGNPYLKHTTANNFDLRYEFFPTALDQFMLGAFYKNIKNPIEQVLTTNKGTLVLQPSNFGHATNYGAEIVLTKYLHNFGFSLNYTFTMSEIITDKILRQRQGGNSTGQIVNVTVKQKRPLQGQSMHVGNATIMYKNQKIGLDAQLSGVYTGRRISQLSPYLGLDYWQEPTAQLDLSIEKKIIKSFTVYSKVNNLLSTPAYVVLDKPNPTDKNYPEQHYTDKITVQRDSYKPTYQIGLRYTY